MKKRRKLDTIAFDLDGTLIGHIRSGSGHYRVTLRPEVEGWLKKARRKFKQVILWTLAGRRWYEMNANQFPILRKFDRIITWEDSPFLWKDVRRFGVHTLVDNDPEHRENAIRAGVEPSHYLIVPTWGEG